jgi:hypothetical protein
LFTVIKRSAEKSNAAALLKLAGISLKTDLYNKAFKRYEKAAAVVLTEVAKGLKK